MSTITSDRRTLAYRIRRELIKAQRERPARPNATESGELEWAVFEREKLLELINAERAKLSMQAVDMAAVMRIENSAAGHFDYTQTLAIGAADLVLAG